MEKKIKTLSDAELKKEFTSRNGLLDETRQHLIDTGFVQASYMEDSAMQAFVDMVEEYVERKAGIKTKEEMDSYIGALTRNLRTGYLMKRVFTMKSLCKD